jgi:hypothetical protein
MKEKVLKIVGYSLAVLIMVVLIYSIFDAIWQTLSKEGISKQFEEIKKETQTSIKEIEEKIAPKIKVPESGLKINAQFEISATTTVSLSLASIIDGNDLYWKIKGGDDLENLPDFFRFVFPLIYGWRRIQITNENLEELKNWGKIFQKNWVFKNFKIRKDGFEFVLDEKKIKNAILEKKNEIKTEEKKKVVLEEFLDSFKEISGRVYLNGENSVKKLEIFGKTMKEESVKIIFEFENLKEVMKNKGKNNFEGFLISILTL